ncbi:MAG TPA: hypothetical protein VGR64_02410 [Terracidiphilus sp.]|nr:hypothetical protein [Terracidiphilus sp.]
MKRLMAVCILVAASAAVSAHAAGSAKISGWISDSMCGAKHAGTGTECVKSCIKNGMKPVFVDSEKKEVWTIDNPSEVTPAFYGAHVNITASVNTAKKSVHIDSIAAAK